MNKLREYLIERVKFHAMNELNLNGTPSLHYNVKFGRKKKTRQKMKEHVININNALHDDLGMVGIDTRLQLKYRKSFSLNEIMEEVYASFCGIMFREVSFKDIETTEVHKFTFVVNQAVNNCRRLMSELRDKKRLEDIYHEQEEST